MNDVAGYPVSNPCSQEALALGRFYHAYPGDSAKYIQCNIWGKAFIKTCPLGTKWHSDVLNCVTGSDTDINMISSQQAAPDQSKGNGHVLYATQYHPVAASTLLDDSAMSNPCSSNGVRYLAHPQLPYKYFVCVNQRPLLASCAYYHIWVQAQARCVDMNQLTTTHATTATTEPTTTTQPPTTTTQPPTTTTQATTTTPPSTTTAAPSMITTMDRSVCLPENVRFHPYPGDVTKYIECRLWQVISVHACPPSQIWYQPHQCCLLRLPTTSATTTSIAPPTPSTPVTATRSQMESTSDQATSTKNFCLGADSHYFPYPPDTAKFIQCDAFGNMFLRYCGSAKVWDDTYKTCVGRNIISWPQDKNNGSDDGQNGTSVKTSDLIDESDEDLPLQVTCPQSYVWVIYTACCQVPVGVVVIQPLCQRSFTWSAKLRMCIAARQPGEVKITTDSTPTTIAPTTQQADENPCGKGNGNYFGVVYDKRLFLQCDDNGHVTVRQCAPGLVWDQQLVSCSRPENEMTPQPAHTVHKPQVARLCSLTSPLYQPHPVNSLLLLMCVRGAPYVMQCPYRATSVCNWPPLNNENTWIQD